MKIRPPKFEVVKIASYWRLMKNGALVATFKFRHEARDAMKAAKGRA